MKKQHSFWYGILFTCCTAFGVLLISSCEKEAPPVIEDPDPVVETELLADSIQDLAGYFNSEMEVFFIDPEYIDHILEYMGAFPTTDGRFGFSELNEEGLWMDYFFQVLPMPVPDIYFTALAVEMELESEGTEGNGVRYKVYKKAECGLSRAAKTGDCQNMAEIDPDTEAASFKTITKAYKKCKASKLESNLCKEKLLPVGETTYYNELNCSGDKTGAKPYDRYRCD
ncbi:MAG: hypothetical protein IPL49_07070 [Saprospirales bacterium]|nr:hypothetical protein [Saprospirales bacterium]